MNTGRAFIGGTLVALGVVYLLDATEVLAAGRLIGDWWPVVLIAGGVALLLSDRRAATGAAIVAASGAIALGFTTGVLGGRAGAIVWPVLVLLAGVTVLVTGREDDGGGPELRSFVLLHRRVLRPGSGFRSAAVTTVLGAVRLDLADTAPGPGEVVVSATAILGGVEVIVPEGWRVAVTGVPILGAWDDTTGKQAGPGSHLLRVRAYPVLGGVEVRHRRRWG